MSAIKNILKLLMIFEDDVNVYSSEEIASELGVSQRQVRNYIKALRDFGYLIEGDSARGGGYRSGGQFVDIPLKVTASELAELGRVVDYMKKNQVFEDAEGIMNLYFKLRKSTKSQLDLTHMYDYRLQYRQIHEKEEKGYLSVLTKCIVENRKVQLWYFSATSRKEECRVVHPYKIQFYQGANYVHGYCEKAKDYRVFKILRIKKIQDLNEEFNREIWLEERLKTQNFGIFTEGTKEVVLEFYYPYNEFAKEIIIGEDQIIEESNSDCTTIKANINNETELVGWIMSFGKSVRVVKPNSLIESIQESANDLINLYIVGSNSTT